jgi:hypothetical protein
MVPVIARAAHPSSFGWLVSRADFNGISPQFQAIEAVDETGRIHGMTGFDGWTENSVVGTIAVDNAAALRTLLVPTFQYVFNQSRRGVYIATVRGTNKKSLRLCKHLGFRETHRIKDAIRVGEDLVLFEMRREECRYLDGIRKAA